VAAREWTAAHPHAVAVVEAAWEAIAAPRPAPARMAGPVPAPVPTDGA
jgi:hypothetical protein